MARSSGTSLNDLQLGTYESLYLCGACHHPLYIQLENQREVCLNRSCAQWPADYSSIVEVDEKHAPKLNRELKAKETQLLASLRRCNLASLRRFAHEERRKLSQSFLYTRGMRISEWHAISELLVLTQKEPSMRLHTPGHEDEATFCAILKEASEWAAYMRLIEDMQTGRYRTLRRQNGTLDASTFALKYLVAARSSERALGLVDRIDELDEAPFEYEHIETAATPSPPPGTPDLADILETLWPFTLHFRHALRSHWRTSQLYEYQPHLIDFTVLAGYWAQCPGDVTCRIPAGKEVDEVQKLDAHLQRFSGGKVTAGDFVKRYIDCETQTPIIVRTPDGWLFDKATLLLFMLYLQGEPGLVRKNVPNVPDVKEPLLDRMRARAGQEFEIWLRAELRSKGFRGPDRPVKVHYEYDILMISETERTIVMADAKYRDVNPSSSTGKNLLSQELLDNRQGLLAEAKRQEDRLVFFLQHQGDFQKLLAPRHQLASYRVRSYLVTKSTPLISRYKSTSVLRAQDFLASVACP